MRAPSLWLLLAASFAWPATARAQTTGTLFGQITDRATSQPIGGATVRTVDGLRGAIADDRGRFVLTAVPVGEATLVVEALGYRRVELTSVRVAPGRPVEVSVALDVAAVSVEGITVEADRFRLIEPDVRGSHEVVAGEELRALPVDATESVVDLAPGVSDGHFRGGRLGQEAYVVDGLEVKNPLEASTEGFGLEFSPTSLEELEVVTGGFGAGVGSAISGLVRLTTRRGNPLRWEGAARVTTDEWAPSSLFTGYSSLSVSGGGPLGFLGRGATVFADFSAQGFRDADPHGRGLACLEAGDVSAPLAAELDRFAADPARASLLCPYTGRSVPHQRGDKLIAFVRFDRPLSEGVVVTAALLGGRLQKELFTPACKCNPG
jgi:hypothetical protein